MADFLKVRRGSALAAYYGHKLTTQLLGVRNKLAFSRRHVLVVAIDV
jgi:hypothetical protein